MPTNFTIYFENISTLTSAITGAGNAVIKNVNTGLTVDTQAVMISSNITSVNSSLLQLATPYSITFNSVAGSGVPAGTFYFNTNLQDYSYTINVPLAYGFGVSTAPGSPALPSPNPNIQTSWLVFYNTATGATLPAGVTCTITVSGGGATVDTQVTNALGQITSTKLNTTAIYQVTFSGGGAPTGTYIIDPNIYGNNTLNPVII